MLDTTQEYVAQLATSNFATSSNPSNDFTNIIDEDLLTGITTDSFATDLFQTMTVSFGEIVYIGAVFLYMSEDIITSGGLRVHAYTDSFTIGDTSL